jgi:hemolysin III
MPQYTPAEELANIVSHGLGALLGIAASIMLVVGAVGAGDSLRVVAFAVYGASLVMLYGASTCYHAARDTKLKRRLRVVDHAAIFLLIAGTYTPVALVSLGGMWGWSLFGVVWSLAVVGIVSKLFFVGNNKKLTAAIYIVMGWLGVIAAKPLYAALPGAAIGWLLAGGLAYTSGTVFYAWKRLPFNHAIWHLFVLAGSGCHFVCMFVYVLPAPMVP